MQLRANEVLLGDFEFIGAEVSAKGPHWEVFLAEKLPPLPRLRRVLEGASISVLFNQLGVSLENDVARDMEGRTFRNRACLVLEGVDFFKAASLLLAHYRGMEGVAGDLISTHFCWRESELWCVSPRDSKPPSDLAKLVFGEDPGWSLEPCIMCSEFPDLEGAFEMAPGRQMRNLNRVAFNADTFPVWINEPLPRLHQCGGQEFLAVHASDTLEVEGDGIYLKTALRAFPQGLRRVGESSFPPWFGTGICQQIDSDDRGVRVRVKVAGFEERKDTLSAELNALYTGDGKNGIHLPPEPNTRVALHWSGRVGDPPLCLGNIRDGQPTLPAAFLDLPKRKGDWKWQVGGNFSLVAENAIDFEADDLKVKVSNTMEVDNK